MRPLPATGPGGPRNQTSIRKLGASSEEEGVAIRRHLCQVLIWVYLQKDNQPSLQELSVYLGTFGITYCKSSISTMLKQWRWSFKIPSVVQSSKYTPLNVQYYSFAPGLPIPISTSSSLWMKCTSTQEVRFFTKMTSLTTTTEFRTRKYAISPIGVAAQVVSHSSLQAASMPATVLVGLDPPLKLEKLLKCTRSICIGKYV